VIELVKIKQDAIKSVNKNDVFMLRDTIVPIMDVSKIMSIGVNNSDGGYLVICKIGEKIVGVKVDSVVGQEEIVIKPLGEFMGNINGVGGATISGDGRVILILDIPSMMSNSYMLKVHKITEEGLEAQPEISQ
jgi:two-component system chemotaxis sensor kinase CheA